MFAHMDDDRERREMFRRSRPAVGPVVARRQRPPKPDPDEGPSEDDLRRFGDVTVTCKGCGTELYDDAAVCYQCGRVVLGDDAKGLPRWAWMVALGLIALFVLNYLFAPFASLFGP